MKTSYSFFLLISSIVYAQIIVPEINNPHPRLLMCNEQILFMIDKIENRLEPWHSSSATLATRASASLSSTPSPYTGRDSYEFYQHCRSQGAAARDLALAHIISGNDSYAQKAIEYITAWSTATPMPASDFDPDIRYPNSGMEVARSAIQIIWAYDLLYNHGLMTTSIKTNFENWLRVLESVIKEGINRWHANNYFGNQFYQNHLAAHTMGLLMIGYTLGDKDLVQFAIDSEDNPRDLVELIAGCILIEGESNFNYGSYPPNEYPPQTGEIIDRYRHIQNTGLPYANLTLNLLLLSAEMAYINGIDFYNYTAPTGENLLLPFEFYADFFISEDACAKGGFYCGESISRSNAGFFELANKRYPNNPAIEKYLNSIPRSKLRTDYIGIPALTHSQELSRPDNQIIALWKMDNTTELTYLDQPRNYVPDKTDYNHKLILGYTAVNTGSFSATLTADAEGLSGEAGDRALWFNGMYSGAFAPLAWKDADKATLSLYIKPYSFDIEQTVIYTTGSFEIRLVPTSTGARINFNVWGSNGVVTAYSASNLILNEWNKIEAYAGNGKAIIIVNDVSGNIINCPSIQVSYDGGIYFGSTHQFNTRFYNGLLDDVEIFFTQGSCSITGYAKADINKDCYVDLLDLSLIAAQWLVCTNPNQQGCIYITQ